MLCMCALYLSLNCLLLFQNQDGQLMMVLVTNGIEVRQRKAANISASYKSDDETDKHNYRPISLLSVPGKLTESMVASTITTHVPGQGLGNPHQWTFDAILHSILLRMNSPATFSQYPLAQQLSIRKQFCRAFPSNRRFFQRNRRISRTVLRVVTLIASVSSHGDNANEKIFKRLAGLLRKIKTLNAQHIFWQISLPSACY